MLWGDETLGEKAAREERERRARQAGNFPSESEDARWSGGGKRQCVVSFLVFLLLIWKPLITFKV